MEIKECYIKYLEMIQNVISRLAGNVDQTNKWCLTSVVAVWVLMYKISMPAWLNIMASCVLILIFWGMASYFLQLEKRYREMHARVMSCFNGIRTDCEMFDLKLREQDKKGSPCVLAIMFSSYLALLYIPLIVVSVTFALCRW